MTTYYTWTIDYPGNTEIQFSGAALPDPLPSEWGDPEQATVVSQVDITSVLQGQKDDSIYAAKVSICEAANSYISSFFTMAEYHEIIKWQLTLGSEHAAQPYITALNSWLAAIHVEAFMKKVDLQIAADALDLSTFITNSSYVFDINLDYSVAGGPPCAFTDIQMLVDTALQAYVTGWSAPSLTGYSPGYRASSSSNSSVSG
jgi:hypothetical protein